MPIFLSEPISTQPISMPFRFTGGFGLSSKTIGLMLSVQGVYAMIAQLILFPLAASHFGSLKLVRFVLMTWPLLYLLVPYLVLLPHQIQIPGVYLCLLWKITAQVFAFPSLAILLANAIPSPLVRGMINGASASTASLARALGPTVTGLIHTWGLEIGSTGLAWWECGIICSVGALVSLWIEAVKGQVDVSAVEDEESLADEALIAPLTIDTIDAAINAVGDLPQSLEEGGVRIGKSVSELNLL